MKISREWLQTFFEKPLPDAQQLADALTFHAFEIESAEGDILDVKVTPNRGHDCLSHRGIAKELSAILDIPMAHDELREEARLTPTTDALAVVVEDGERCPRFSACLVRNVKVGPSPEWLVKRLESLGQRSINNVVDATNYVMFHLGQPLHAFDADKLTGRGGAYALTVRAAKDGERLTGLDDKEYALTSAMTVIEDANAKAAASIAGIKGGRATGIDERTSTIILEAANWNGPMIRKTSAALKLRTDASDRFQQVISPELAAHGLAAAVRTVLELAGGDVAGFVDVYPHPQKLADVTVSLEQVNGVLGTDFLSADVENVFKRLGFAFANDDGAFTVTPPIERLDIVIPEDLVEEVGRIMGYDKVPARPLPPFATSPDVNPNFYAAEKKREEYMQKGYSEVVTSVFADEGEIAVANKVDGARPYLRRTLVPALEAAREMNARNRMLLGLKDVNVFEVGTVWQQGKEKIVFGVADGGGAREIEVHPEEAPKYDGLPTSATERYQPFSRYPYIVRDIAMWIPESANAFTEAVQLFTDYNRGLLRHVELFDQFKKGDRVSYAFHLVFQSFEKTLTDAEVNQIMEDMYTAARKKGWEVR